MSNKTLGRLALSSPASSVTDLQDNAFLIAQQQQLHSSTTNHANTQSTIKLSPYSSQQQQQQQITTKKDEKTEKIDKQSLEYIIRSGTAGGIAGISAKTLIAPLDRVKILFQTSNPQFKQYAGSFRGMFKAMDKIYLCDGFKGLYQGHSATLLRIFPYAAIKFVCYEQIRTILIPKDEYETALRRLLAGSLAGVCSVACTYPLDLIRVRLAFETGATHKKQNWKVWNILKTIWNETPRFNFNTGGNIKNEPPLIKFVYSSRMASLLNPLQSLTNFYRGFVPTIFGMVPYAGVSFYTHDLIHDFFRSPLLAKHTVSPSTPQHDHKKTNSNSSFDTRKPLKTWAQLLAGGGAGMLAQAAAYPFEVIRRRLQVGAVMNSGGEFFSIGKIAQVIYRERGVKGFYVGLGIGFIKVVPMFACSFYVYERCKNWLLI